MENITEILNSFSEEHDLWNLTKKSALECIKNYAEEEDNNEIVFEEISLKSQKQELVFWEYGNKTFILRTTYSLHKNNDFTIPIGDYAMDVDSRGEIIDDWLVIY
ncbi:hypothetical protein L1S35_05195 [Flavobacterium sp. AS60]|uniref:hypothetical protein n=1 Tax=Flavobacterium anseongense TaxID=2910677 RepID=UPI001F1D2B9E|nr:hypothetical protein [Flavobacterium sp. AS60]MCF6129060.1 hypothetical protein [Flavobacterium sp. AS60]